MWLHGTFNSAVTSAGISANLAAFLRGMTKHDAYFHLLLGGVLVGGFLFMGTAGEAMWASMNKGVIARGLLYHHPFSANSCSFMLIGCSYLAGVQKLFKDLPPRDKPAGKKVKRQHAITVVRTAVSVVKPGWVVMLCDLLPAGSSPESTA